MSDDRSPTPLVDLVTGILDGLIGDGEHPVDDDLVASLKVWGGKYRRQYAACVRHQANGVFGTGRCDDLQDVGNCDCKDADHCFFVLKGREIVEHCGLFSVAGDTSTVRHGGMEVDHG